MVEIEIENLLQTKVNGVYPKRILLQGVGGAGKTTLCSKIAWEWVNGRHFTEFELVLAIPLRKSKKRSVGEITKSYLSDNNFVEPAQIDAYILSNPDKVLLIFDGLDELDANFDDLCEIIQILVLKRHISCKVLVTSRPWKADIIRKNSDLRRAYAFIRIEGFSKENISLFIQKFFAENSSSAAELIQLMKDNDVISENMARFPIYTTIMCYMWKDFDSERRAAIQKLQTFSQLFNEMIGCLTDHYISKGGRGSERRKVLGILEQIGEAAFKGLQENQMVLTEKYFDPASVIQTGCKVGVISQEKKLPSRTERRGNADTDEISVVFPHRLFQEYTASLFLANLYSSNRERYDLLSREIVANMYEYRYVLYFTSARGEDIGLDILTRLIREGYNTDRDFLVDVAFECHKPAAAKFVLKMLLSRERKVTISTYQSAHTVYGHLFVLQAYCQLVMQSTRILHRLSPPPQKKKKKKKNQ